MYVLGFGEKKRNFFEGGDPPWPPRNFFQKNIFAPDPQFLFYNIKVLHKIGCLQKTRVQKIEN